MLHPSRDDPDQRLIQEVLQSVRGSEVTVRFAARDPEDVAAANTAEELNRVFDED